MYAATRGDPAAAAAATRTIRPGDREPAPVPGAYATASSVRRLAELSAAANRAATAPTSSSPVVQRVKANGVEVTADQIAAEADPVRLNAWLDDADWDDPLIAVIEQRLAALKASAAAAVLAGQNQAAALALQQAEAQARTLMADRGVAPAHFDYATYLKLEQRHLHAGQRADFFNQAAGQAAARYAVLEAAGGASVEAIKHGLIAFSHGADEANAAELARSLSAMVGWRHDSVDLDELSRLTNLGVITVSRVTYVDDPRRAGSVYELHLHHTAVILMPEWHVHWGPQNRVDASSWKNRPNRTAVGPGVRTDTAAVVPRLKAIVTAAGLWGPS